MGGSEVSRPQENTGAGYVVLARYVQGCCGRRPGATLGNCHRAVGVTPQESEGAECAFTKLGNECWCILLVPSGISVSRLWGRAVSSSCAPGEVPQQSLALFRQLPLGSLSAGLFVVLFL